MQTVIADFWEVIDPQGNPFDLLPVLEGAATLPTNNRMKDRGPEHSDLLFPPECHETHAFGLAVRIRKVNLPEKGNFQTGEVAPLFFQVNEGAAEEAHFLYDRPLQTLVTQRHKVLRVSGIETLLRDVTGAMFDVQPKLREDAWARFERMTSIGSVELKLRAPAFHPDFSQSIPSMGSFLDEAANEINARTVDLKFSMGRGNRRESMNLALLKRVARAFRGGNDLNQLTVRGRIPGAEKTEVVDFIRDRLVFSGQVEYAERRLDARQCQHLLRAALDRHREYLQSLI